MKCISFYMWQVFLWIHHLIRAEEIICCIYLWLPVGAAVTLHVHASLGGVGGLMAWYWARRLWMVDWVKWTVTTIWFAFTWSSCFPYFPFVCSPGSTVVQCEKSDVMLLRILSFQLHPLSLLLSTAATSAANLLSIIFQIEFKLKTKGFGLKLLTLYKINFEYFPLVMSIYIS